MDRRQFVNEQLDLKGSGLEIGPSYNPFFPKRDGYNVKTLDHASGETLRQKYGCDPAVEVSKIEDVDFVWNGQQYAELIGEEKFDWVFAAHLIEHVPDLIAFINDSATIMKEKGMLALAIPDKRYTFDMMG
jgi:2-polyprenyl-3-methyl-5-hydroxy-6-metoxy-1,4-benzoquinol methylase